MQLLLVSLQECTRITALPCCDKLKSFHLHTWRMTTFKEKMLTYRKYHQFSRSLSKWAFGSTPVIAFSKFGTATALILGAVVGNRFRKERETVGGNHELETALHPLDAVQVPRRYIFTWKGAEDSLKRHHPEMNEKIRVMLDLHSRIMKVLSKMTVSSISSHYLKVAEENCYNYLSCHGLKNISTLPKQYPYEDACDWIDNTDFWPMLRSPRPPKPPRFSKSLSSVITALLCISGEEVACMSLVEPSLLLTLKEIYRNHEDLKVSVARIVCNLSAIPDSHSIIQETGWMEILQILSEDPQPASFLPAWRALHNIKNLTEKDSESKKEIYVEGVYPCNPPDVHQDYAVDIVLVHGVMGGAGWTWRQHDSEKHKQPIAQSYRKKLFGGEEDLQGMDDSYTWCWPLDWLLPTLPVPARLIAVDYRSRWWSWGCECSEEAAGSTLEARSKWLKKTLELAGVGERPIIWITHSLGGLLVKTVLTLDTNDASRSEGTRETESESKCPKCQNQNREHSVSEEPFDFTGRPLSSLDSKTRALIFYSVPHFGSPLARISKHLALLFQPTAEVREVQSGSKSLKELNEKFIKSVKNRGWEVLSLNESKPSIHHKTGLEFVFVPPESADIGVGHFYEVEATHLDICKPVSQSSKSFTVVKDFVLKIVTQPNRKEE
ncbi:protein SERAC1-like [Oratosquilla oratoria]|uniref:protein SERAC1-like n=1 Tax=Oratosquilla oratoria TaxID=337810 RepID=UPI003F76C89C